MKITKQAVLILLFAFILSLIIMAPAALIHRFMPEGGAVNMNGLSGTIWRGQATQFVYNNQNLGALKWRLSPLTALTGKLGANFELEGNDLRADGFGKVDGDRNLWLKDTNLRLNAAAIPLSGAAAAVRTNGVINAKVDSLVLNNNRPQSASARLTWKNANVSAPIDLDVGDLIIDINGDDGAIKAIISTAQNSTLDINGVVDLAADGS